MDWLSYVVAALFLVACGASGSLALLLRARGIDRRERGYGIVTPRLREIASVLGALAGLVIGGTVLYFASRTSQFNLIEWVGRGSYLLVTGAASGHLLILIRTALHLQSEEAAWASRGNLPKGLSPTGACKLWRDSAASISNTLKSACGTMGRSKS